MKQSISARRFVRAFTLAPLALLLVLLAGCSGQATPAATAGPTTAAATKPPAASSPATAASPSPTVAASPSPAVAASPSASPAAVAAPARKLNVVATTTQVQDFVRIVGGDRVNVLGILPPDADAHDYQPTAEDARKFAQAEVVFANGAGLEPWLEDLAKGARPDTLVVQLAHEANLKLRSGGEEEHAHGDHEHEHGGADPHVWFDPTNAQKMVNVVRDTLAKAEQPGTSAYTANAAAYNRELDALDAEIKQQIATIPDAQRKLVTNHDVFGYYAERYGLEVVGSVIPSTSTEAEPSAADLQKLVQDIKAEGVKAIFTERSANPRLEQQIAQQAGVKVVPDLYADSLGPSGSEGDTYLKMMRSNTRAIVQGLRS